MIIVFTINFKPFSNIFIYNTKHYDEQYYSMTSKRQTVKSYVKLSGTKIEFSWAP